MELTCAIFVITVGLGAASPYGYGTKSGALAKAESSAVAGGLPITAPSGTGYSGSYAKSSSSSFASSSASSSASSFSYSGSGVVPGATGCGTGACPSSAGYSPTAYGSQSYVNNNAGSTGTESTGSGNNYNSDNANQGQRGDIEDSQKATDCGSGSCLKPPKPAGYSNGLANSFSQANSVASTGAEYGSPSKGPTIPDSGCAGGDCGNQPGPVNDKCISGQCGGNANNNLKVNDKCTSGNCQVPQTASVAPLRVSENNCASGNCGSTKDDNDIAVSKPNNQGTIHFPDKDKETNYGSSCAYGNCEPNNAKPIYSQDSVPVLESAKCNTPGCNNYGQSPTAISNAVAAVYNKQSTQLLAPKEHTACTTPNCQSGPVNTKPYDGYSPNYNAPSSIPTPDRNPSQCAGSTCFNSQTKTPSYSTNYVNPTPGPIGNGCISPNCDNNSPIKPSSNCAGGSCDYNPSSENSKVPGYNTNYPQGGATYNTPVPSGSGCSPGSSNCSPGPVSSGQYNPVVTPSPYYTPPILGSPTSSSTYNKPTFKPVPVDPSGYSGSLNYPYSQPNNAYAAASAAQQSNGYNKPGSSGYGSYPSGPAFTSQGTSPSAGYSSAPNSGFYNSPGTYPAPGLNSPTQNCNTPSCLVSGISNSVPSSATSGNIPEPVGAEKEKLPVYQGGFGGPEGILNPHDFHFSPPPVIKPSTLPGVPVGKPDCVSGNCEQPFHGGFGGPAGTLKPNELNISPPTGFKPGLLPVAPVSKPDCVSGNCEQPFHGGFGGPPGILKPNELNISPPTSFKPGSLPVTPVSKPDCVSGSCEQPFHGGFGGPPGILKPNGHDISPPTGFKPGSSPVGSVSKPDCVSGKCGQPIVGSFSPSYAQSGTNSGAQSSASAKAVAYTGGFGGPPGILSPYDDGKINLPIGSKQFSQTALTQDSGNHVSNANENGSHGHSGAQAQSIAQANAVAGGTYGVNPQTSGYKSGGCDGGCSGSSGGTNYGSNGGYGLSKSGTADGVNGDLSIASASAKSIAGAVPNIHGGYASSSASAQASSGIKSSYGKR